ncbi:MAG: prepilin peptidase [Phycisphaerales bacterium]|nr:MAG: prepilin peptidase [Phycisphaerales bacterium]
MGDLEFLQFMHRVVMLGFMFAFGACVGSLINVLVWRLPRGLGVVTPASACPSCGTRLTWRENIPVIGWIMLRGRCRFCSARVSAEYPIVEAIVGFLFVATYLLCYGLPDAVGHMGAPHAMAPAWAGIGVKWTWPIFVMWLILLGCLVAMTIVDAKTFTIPAPLTTVPLVLGLVVHPAYAAWVSSWEGLKFVPSAGWTWVIPSPGGQGWGVWWIGLALGGAAGLVLANVLMATGLIRRSFLDAEEWERGEVARLRALHREKHVEGTTETPGDAGTIEPATAAVVGLSLEKAEEDELSADEEAFVFNPEVWRGYPHARREVLREVIFLAPVIGLGLLGGWVALKVAGCGPSPSGFGLVCEHSAPLWLDALAGALLGMLIGGGAVWFVRIAGSLAFGKEAMGLGDVHMMAAVGACLGWIDATLGFLGSAFVGILWAIFGLVLGGRLKRSMPLGPFLAVATVLVVVCKPLLIRWLVPHLGAWEVYSIP